MKEQALNTQVGGSHYKDMVIQPVEFIERNNLGYCVGNIIKYVCRYKNKNGIEDLEKAKHYLEILIDIEKDNQTTSKEDILHWINEQCSTTEPEAELAVRPIEGWKKVLDSYNTNANIIAVGDPTKYEPTNMQEKAVTAKY